MNSEIQLLLELNLLKSKKYRWEDDLDNIPIDCSIENLRKIARDRIYSDRGKELVNE